VGPSGCGKSQLARSVAEVLDAPFVHLDCLELAETSWQGTTVPDYLGELHRAAVERCRSGATPAEVAAVMGRAVIIIDEAHHLGYVDGVAGTDGVTRAFRIGRQTSLMPLLEGYVPLHYSPTGNGERTATFKAAGTLRIVCGAFTGLGTAPTPEALRAYGLQSEFVERLGEALELRAPPPDVQGRVLERGLAPLREAYCTYGYGLRVNPETLRYAAAAVSRGAGGSRAGVAWLKAAAYVALERLLEAGAPLGTVYELVPDDVRVPQQGGAQRGPRR
jgi:hypothetical protein